MRSGWGARGTFVAVITALTLLSVAPGAPAQVSIMIPPILNEQTRTIGLSGTIRSVIVRSDFGEITLAPGSTHFIHVHETWNYARPTLTHTLRNGVLSVRASCPNDPTSFNKCSNDLTLVVPKAVTVDAFSNFGDVTTKALKGNEKLGTDFGDIRATGVSVGTISAVTSYGKVSFALASPPKVASGRSSFGDIAIKVPAGTYDVDASTDWGDVTVKGITRSDDATRRITASTSYGDIAVSRI
jgi:hypothetical protein